MRDWLRDAEISALEECAFLAGIGLLVVGLVVAAATSEVGEGARVAGLAGLLALLVLGAARGVHAYRRGTPGALPSAIGRRAVRIRPARLGSALTVLLALVLPAVAALALVLLIDWAWIAVAAVVLLGCAVVMGALIREARDPYQYWMENREASEIVRRLSMRADIPPPEVVVEHDVLATAWTRRGRIHLTSELVDLLDDAELEAVLAHEIAHLARRDAAVMEICSAPSRVLLSYAGLVRSFWRLRQELVLFDIVGSGIVGGFVTAAFLVTVPIAFAVGWVSRLSVLGMSRTREHAADAGAATLTGNPGALISALLKLEAQDDWAPRRDLRQVAPILCIIDPKRRRLGRLLSSHPATAARVRRLTKLQSRVLSRA